MHRTYRSPCQTIFLTTAFFTVIVTYLLLLLIALLTRLSTYALDRYRVSSTKSSLSWCVSSPLIFDYDGLLLIPLKYTYGHVIYRCFYKLLVVILLIINEQPPSLHRLMVKLYHLTMNHDIEETE